MSTPAYYKWLGLACTALPTAMLLFSATMKFLGGPQLEQGMKQFGWPMSIVATLGVLELACTALYLFPRTAVLGAILLTGYLGGATATHLRIGDAWFAPVILGVVLWGGLWFRDARVRALLPLRA